MTTRSEGLYAGAAGTPPAQTTRTPLVLTERDYRVLGPADFGGPGLYAVEVIGPFVALQAVGPLVTVHDSTVEPHLGIGHHPHRYHERLFYMLAGTLDHDDALNGIRGRMGPGEVGQLTEGRRGMVHSEWNHGDEPARAFILVYPADPLPERASFTLLRDADAPRDEEGEGVQTKELVGPRSPLRPHGDIRRYTDSRLEPGARLHLVLNEGEGALLSIQEGRLHFEGQEEGQELRPGMTVIVPPGRGEASLAVQATEPARVLRVVFGPGYGLVRRTPAGAGR